jgi:hypothetical protein
MREIPFGAFSPQGEGLLMALVGRSQRVCPYQAAPKLFPLLGERVRVREKETPENQR